MKKQVLVIILSAIALTACKDEEKTQTKDWYKQHDAERATRVKECKSDRRLEVTFDCQNALEAESDIFVFGK
jgi:outer membrane lipoprotein SlyB